MRTRKPLIAANWKMGMTQAQSLEYMRRFYPMVEDHARDEIALFPPTVSLASLAKVAQSTHIAIGAQSMHWLDEGCYTGETSPRMLISLECEYVLLAHSECRTCTGDSGEQTKKSVKAAIRHGLKPVICVGETLDQRQAGLTSALLSWQIASVLFGCQWHECEDVVIAYEPVWAGKRETPVCCTDVQEAHQLIRKQVGEVLGLQAAEQIRIVYGGPVNRENIAGLMELPDVDGVLAGYTGLEPEPFAEIVRYGLD